MYLNYYEQVVNSKDDGKPIGIILCAEKDNIMLEFALGGLSNNIFASIYTYYIPNKEQLINEVEKVLYETKKDDIEHYCFYHLFKLSFIRQMISIEPNYIEIIFLPIANYSKFF